MRKIRLNSDRVMQRRVRAALGDIGDLAKMHMDNFETIMGFKPALKLLDAAPHNPPEMNTRNTPIPTGKDNNVPSAGEINQGLGKDYPLAPPSEVEKVPHEDENVNQTDDTERYKEMPTRKKKSIRKRAFGEDGYSGGEFGQSDIGGRGYETDHSNEVAPLGGNPGSPSQVGTPSTVPSENTEAPAPPEKMPHTKESPVGEPEEEQVPGDENVETVREDQEGEGEEGESNEGGEDNDGEEAHHDPYTRSYNSEEEARLAQEEFQEKFILSSKLADIKVAAGLWDESQRYDKVQNLIRANSLESIESILEENEQMFSRLQASKQAQIKQASIPTMPYGVPMGQPKEKVSDLAAVLGGFDGWSVP